MVDKYPNPAAAFRDVYEQYVEEASFLWQMRSIAVDQPHYTRQDLARLENRLQAQLNGLMSAPDMAWEVCEQALELGGPGEVFAATYIAVKTHVQERIQLAVEAGLSTPEAFPGLVSVFGWLPQELSYPWIERFLNSKDLQHKYLAIAICSIRRENPGEFLNRIFQRDDCRQHPALLGRAVRIVGELGRQDLRDQLHEFSDSDDPDTQFWVHWSSILLGDSSAAMNMQDFVFQPGPHQKRAIDIVFRSLPISDAREWISRMAELPEQQRQIVQAVGILGDPHAIDWLIGKTQLPELSRLAGEAFTSISGIDLEANQLALADDHPGVPSGALDDENSDKVEMDDDENLPWPNPPAIAQYWAGIRGRFQDGERYLLGMPVEQLNTEMASSPLTQRQLRAMAMELALKAPGQGLANVSGKVI
jgi:uncharacterized protein (TIGR02270 family)